MRRGTFIHIMFVGLFFLFALPYSAKASPVLSSKSKNGRFQAHKMPHAELELAHQQFTGAVYSHIQKKLLPFYSCTASTAIADRLVIVKILAGNSYLAYSHHLLLLFPFHHFW